MRKFRVPLNSFQFGEVSPSTLSRIDTPIYVSSAQRLENVIVRAEGAAVKRSGMKNIYDFGITKSSSKRMQNKLLPFIFSDDERYIISIEDAKVRAFRVVSDTSVVLVSTLTADTDSAALPFDDDYMHEYTFAQSGDTMFVCHPTFMPRMIVRTSLTAFEVQTYAFDNRSDDNEVYQPYSSYHPSGMTLDPSAVTGTGITLTTSAAYWDTTGSVANGVYPDSTHVGVRVRYGTSEIVIVSVVSSTVVNANVVDTLVQRLSILNPFRTITGSTTVEVTNLNHGYSGSESITFSDSSAVGGISASNINGARTVTGILDDNTFTFTAGGSASSQEDGGGSVNISTHNPSTNWNEQAFSAKRGYPAAVTFHENRLVFAGTLAEPDSLWFSKSSQYFNFDIGDAEDADSINLIAATGDVNAIRYLVSDRDLQVFTASAELYVPTFLNQAITPTNATIRKQTPFGCSFVQPTPLDGATVFVQLGSKVVREYLYTDNEDAYTSTAVSTIASHLIDDFKDVSVINGAFQKAESYCVFVSTNGDCSVFGSNRAEKRAGWTRFTTQGSFNSVVSIDDRLFAAVWFDDANLRLCEFITTHHLDNSKVYTISSKSTSVSGDFANDTVVHVIGKTSSGREDYLGTHTVAANAISLAQYDETYATAEIGYKFTVNITTNPIDSALPNGPVTGEPRGISTVVVDLVDTRSASVNNISLITDDSVTGKREFRLLGYSRDPQVTITQNEPLPFQVNGLTAELIV
tara:strand:+ start:261 stop:2501 length:2241 start_codon:yes stop_codon:yes gene_type:complete